MSDNLMILAQDAKAWPFEQARALRARLERLGRLDGRTVLFETGYGPSGLPHIGTFGEVARTTMPYQITNLSNRQKKRPPTLHQEPNR